MPRLSTAPPVASLVANGVTKYQGSAPVLLGVGCIVGPEHKVGVVGPNGVGKTTFLRILAGAVEPDEGSVALSPATATVGYLAQEPEVEGEETLRQLLSRRLGVSNAEALLAEAAEALSTGEPGAAEAYQQALDRYLALGAADFDARSVEETERLGLSPGALDRPVAELSGGERAKTALAAVILSRFDILLLDEPTNDLDFEGLDYLESFLEKRNGGLVVVSHDRAFLEGIVTSVLEIDEWTHEARTFGGGYQAYLEDAETARRHERESYEDYQQKRRRLLDRQREQRQWALTSVSRESKRPRDNDKAQRDFRINRTEKQASKVRITEKALDRLEVIERPYEPWVLDLDLGVEKRSGDVVARLDRAVVRRGEWQLGPVDLEIAWAERIAVLGPNGSGKSALLGALLGTLPLAGGKHFLGPSVVAGSLDQSRQKLSSRENLLQGFIAESGLARSEARSLLAKLGLSAGDVERPLDSLSPGERTRAELAVLMARGANCLVLDEPTNHLDLPAIEQLESALSSWRGTLLLVTHDRRLLERVTLERELRLSQGQIVSDTAR